MVMDTLADRPPRSYQPATSGTSGGCTPTSAQKRDHQHGSEAQNGLQLSLFPCSANPSISLYGTDQRVQGDASQPA